MTIKWALVSLSGLFLLGWKGGARYSEPLSARSAATPVLVELFTSEGCSSCPPADRFLQKLDQQTVAGAEVIVLSEHVDYWNHIGWKDPYSAHFYSERQRSYAKRFNLDSVYTPQMVVDGVTQFVGSDIAAADKALAKAIAIPKLPVRISFVSSSPEIVGAHIEAGKLDRSFGVQEAELYIAIALNRTESQVSSGENAGHKLEHVGVVRELRRIGVLKLAQGFSQDVQLERRVVPGDARLIAFVQERQQGRVLGAAQLTVKANESVPANP